jgi:hypothetical protein
MKNALVAGLMAGAAVFTAPDAQASAKFCNRYVIECHDADGNLKWSEKVENLVTTAGATDALAKYFKGAAYTAAFYVGLYGGTGTLAAADTMASHAGWTEVTAYSGSRPALTLGTAAAGSVDNSASKAVFTMTGSATVLGSFVATDSTNGGTTGTLYGEGAFSAPRSVVATDTITVQVTLTLS